MIGAPLPLVARQLLVDLQVSALEPAGFGVKNDLALRQPLEERHAVGGDFRHPGGQEKFKNTLKELEEERDAVKELLG